jgi:hypothetical protein
MPSATLHLVSASSRGRQAKAQKFKRYAIGLFHTDIAEVQTVEKSVICSLTSTGLPSSPPLDSLQRLTEDPLDTF